MVNLGIFTLILILFYLLGKAAELTIDSIKKIGKKLGIKIFFLGLLLGVFTSLPELAIGINTLINNVQEISLGNLLGGLMVLFGLILGISLILNRKIETDGRVINFLPILIYLILPVLFGLDGKIGFIDGIILVAAYFSLLYYLYKKHKNSNPIHFEFIRNGKILKDLFLVLLGLILIIVFSNLIVRLTAILLNNFDIPGFIIGLVLFSIGTNLPEIIVTIQSWRKNIKELSISNLVGSAMANILIIGIFSVIKTLSTEINLGYYMLLFFLFVLFLSLLVFYKTKKEFSRSEGIFLLCIYFLFLSSQLIFLVYLTS